jgi:hypothetical protein
MSIGFGIRRNAYSVSNPAVLAVILDERAPAVSKISSESEETLPPSKPIKLP